MTADGAWRILLADDHTVVRAGLRALLVADPRCEIAGEASSLEQLRARARHLRPDLIVLDLSFGSGNALDTLPELLAVAGPPRVVVLTMHDDLAHARAAFTAGAHGYLVKEAAADELLRAVETVMAGSRYLHAELGARLARAGHAALDELTRREQEVLELLARGYTNAETAAHLNVSLRTVEAVRAGLRGRLGTHSRAGMVEAAKRLGLLA
ncbi:response regulator transcription factor [Actinoplanes subtropicus]|uniref:response regulator transcription factor n=1 Tax=Actinoplanes subtropicus TaxID=543632 RepID=UPI0004C2D769|nr:response regulator transcription factor [Actinoplanes subtropicus]